LVGGGAKKKACAILKRTSSETRRSFMMWTCLLPVFCVCSGCVGVAWLAAAAAAAESNLEARQMIDDDGLGCWVLVPG
jgi:hypothetical protein